MPTLHDRLIEVLRRHFAGVAFDESAPDLGVGAFAQWDSLSHFNFLMAVEDAFETRFSLEEISELKTLAAIEAALAAR